MPEIFVDSARLYFERHGSGSPLFFISGLRGLASHWRNQIPEFSASHSVIVHDQRGTGQSDHMIMRYSIEQMAADVLALMDYLDIGRAHIVGHSTGAAIGQVLALDHTDRVSSLVLVSGWPKSDYYFQLNFELRVAMLKALGPQAFERYSTLFVNPPWIINAKAGEKHGSALQPPAEVTLARIEAILAFDRSAQLGDISVPTLVMCSADDRLTPLYFSKQLADSIPGSHFEVMQDAGHSCHQTMPEEFNKLVRSFLNEVTQLDEGP